MLKSTNILLRHLKEEDLSFLYDVENDESLWVFGSEKKYFTKEILKNYIQNAQEDINTFHQLRLVIDYNNNPIGFIDLFDYTIERAGVGVLIIKKYRRKGLAKESLTLLISYSCNILKIKELFCNIESGNIASIRLFKSLGFKKKKSYNNTGYYILGL